MTYIPEPDPHPDLPYHVKYKFDGGGEVTEARCAHCGEHWVDTGETSFEEWYREHSRCVDEGR